MYRLRIELKGLPSLQSGAFGHWRARRAHDARWKNLVRQATRRELPKEPLEKALVVCTRYSAARSSPDRDNLVASFKPLVDGLAGYKVGNVLLTQVLIDDSPEHMTAEYHWEKCPRGKGRVVMEVSEVGEG